MRTLLLSIETSIILLFGTASFYASAQQELNKARHAPEDYFWAEKSGLSENAIREMRRMAEVADNSSELIDFVDTKSLRHRKQILLVTADGNGHCLALHVFERKKRYERVWSSEQLPGGGGYCRESPVNPRAYVRNRKIVVEIPAFDYRQNVSKPSSLYIYRWNGKTYLPAKV